MKRPEITSATSAANFGTAVQMRLLMQHSSSHIRWYGLRDRFTFGTFDAFVDERWDGDYFTDDDKEWIVARFIQLRLER